jgi:TIR domain
MVQGMANKIFLSYRRDDSSGYTGLLFNRLAIHYGKAAVFRDVHSIHPLDSFRVVIEQSLSRCAIVLVVVSKQWTRIAGSDGTPRLHQPDDIVCWEIESALAHDVPVLPVLVGGAQMPSASDLPENIRNLASINALEMTDPRWEEDFERLVQVVSRIVPASALPTVEVNPYSMRTGIRDDAFFYNRERERRTLRDYLRGAQNCQLLGPHRIGKSSVLLFVQRHCLDWCPSARAAYLDLHDPRCHTFAGWLNEISNGFKLQPPPRTLSELMEAIEDLVAEDVQPILLLDEFSEMTRRANEFSREVYLTLRACGQRGMSIITAARKRLSDLTDPRDDSSSFFNIFPVLRIREFSTIDARKYVELERAGVPAFTVTETERILEFAQCHPLALQTACFHVLAARESGEGLQEALLRAREDCDFGHRNGA